MATMEDKMIRAHSERVGMDAGAGTRSPLRVTFTPMSGNPDPAPGGWWFAIPVLVLGAGVKK